MNFVHSLQITFEGRKKRQLGFAFYSQTITITPRKNLFVLSGKLIEISTLALIQLSLLNTRGCVLFLSTGKRKFMLTLVEHIKKFYNLKVGFDSSVGSIQERFCQTTRVTMTSLMTYRDKKDLCWHLEVHS